MNSFILNTKRFQNYYLTK